MKSRTVWVPVASVALGLIAAIALLRGSCIGKSEQRADARASSLKRDIRELQRSQKRLQADRLRVVLASQQSMSGMSGKNDARESQVPSSSRGSRLRRVSPQERLLEIVGNLERYMSDEAKDGVWARTREQEFEKAFKEESLQAVELVQVTCRTTICRVTVDFGNLRKKRSSATEIGRLAVFKGTELFFHAGDQTAMRGEYYVARRGQTLPAPPPL